MHNRRNGPYQASALSSSAETTATRHRKMTATRRTGVIMIATATAFAEWTATGLNRHSQTLLFRLSRHRQPNCLSSSFALPTASSTSLYSWPAASSNPTSPPHQMLIKPKESIKDEGRWKALEPPQVRAIRKRELRKEDAKGLWDAYEVVTRFQIGRRDVQLPNNLQRDS
ncbi:hypothetical protein K443DRAFT_624887 [Laccaria amethystina LaAM-08-1]|uniref:Uncharacterized protein n=1 Tax=Laccaria amethystina LaAM-08-1 TaxID=1095629 RepID=A0A0C9XT58_9AGAR|nr:hypothetical protein K443DRAFT_624887 [Laccaria amethystina LaAM-08-1]